MSKIEIEIKKKRDVNVLMDVYLFIFYFLFRRQNLNICILFCMIKLLFPTHISIIYFRVWKLLYHIITGWLVKFKGKFRPDLISSPYFF